MYCRRVLLCRPVAPWLQQSGISLRVSAEHEHLLHELRQGVPRSHGLQVQVVDPVVESFPTSRYLPKQVVETFFVRDSLSFFPGGRKNMAQYGPATVIFSKMRHPERQSEPQWMHDYVTSTTVGLEQKLQERQVHYYAVQDPAAIFEGGDVWNSRASFPTAAVSTTLIRVSKTRTNQAAVDELMRASETMRLNWFGGDTSVLGVVQDTVTEATSKFRIHLDCMFGVMTSPTTTLWMVWEPALQFSIAWYQWSTTERRWLPMAKTTTLQEWCQDPSRISPLWVPAADSHRRHHASFQPSVTIVPVSTPMQELYACNFLNLRSCHESIPKPSSSSSIHSLVQTQKRHTKKNTVVSHVIGQESTLSVLQTAFDKTRQEVLRFLLETCGIQYHAVDMTATNQLYGGVHCVVNQMY